MKKNYIIVFLLVATELIGFGLIIPVLPQISSQFTSSGLMLGFLLSSYSLAQFISAPILGQISDKVGRKPILVLSKIGTILSYCILAYSSSYTLILISRLLDGFTGGNIAVARAYLTDITPEEHRSKAMAIIGVAFGTGFIFGPALGGICYSLSNDFKIAGLVGGVFSLISLIITIFFLKEPDQKLDTEKPKLEHFRGIPLNSILLLSLSLVGMMIFSGFETSFSIYTDYKFGLNSKQNSFLFLIIGVVAFFIQGSLIKISIKPIKKAIFISFLCIGCSLVLSALQTSLILSLSPLILLILGMAILNTHIPAELSTLTNRKGAILGIYESINSIARILGPILIISTFYQKIGDIYLYLGLITLIFLFFSQVIFYKISKYKL